MVGCVNATGNDIRPSVCPNHALVNAAGLLNQGSITDVGRSWRGLFGEGAMKSAAHLKIICRFWKMWLLPLLFWVTKTMVWSPVMRLDLIGKHDVGAGSPQQAIMTSLILKPLSRLGLKMTEIDKYSTEYIIPNYLPSGSGDTALHQLQDYGLSGCFEQAD